jgi:L-alanine-DL-glutamate epimerase-like enolase superfamily enzyme
MKEVRVSKIDVYLVEHKVKGNFADSTRKVETEGYVVVDITTDNGLHGVGLTYNEVGGEAIVDMITKALGPKIIGRSPLEAESIYEECFHFMRGVGRKGLAFCALSALDLALWDLKGKIFDIPLYRLLGGTKKELPAYASGGWTSYSRDELAAEAKAMTDRGYKFIKVKIGVQGGKNPKEDIRRIAAVRDAVGPDIGIMIDANNAFTAATAVKLANEIKESDILFFEEPVFADDIPGLVRFRQGTDIPLATGEHEYTKFGVRDLLSHGAADIVQVDITKCGGVTETMKILALTQAYNVLYAPHGMELMHMHVLSAAPNGLFLERLFMFEEVSDLVFINPPQVKNGILTLSDDPGMGLKINYDSVKSFPKQSV